MFSYPVKFFHSSFKNAPVITNLNGQLTALLDAVLVNGFNTVTLSSLSHSGYLATANFTAHGFVENQIIEISGANEAGYNGQWRVVGNPGLNSFQFLLDSAVTTPTTATGTITCKTPGLDFEIAYTGTNKRAYRSKNILSNRFYFKVDDDLDSVWNPSYVKYAKVGIYESMNGIDSYSGNYAPYSSANPNLNWVGTGTGVSAIGGWYKWHYSGSFWLGAGAVTEALAVSSNTTNKNWTIVGDDRGFYIFIEPQPGIGKWGACFTDFQSNKIGDKYNTLFSARDWNQAANAQFGAYNRTDHLTEFNNIDNNAGKLIIRSHSGIGGAVPFSLLPGISGAWTTNSGQTISGFNTGINYPNVTDNTLIIAPIYIKETNINAVRGKLPGITWVNNNVQTGIPEHTFMSGFTEFPGKTFMTVQLTVGERIWPNTLATNRSNFMFDITGPWY
jgi:hypothetical protein